MLCGLLLRALLGPLDDSHFTFYVPLGIAGVVSGLVAYIAGILATARRGQYGWLVAGVLLGWPIFLLWAVLNPSTVREVEVSAPGYTQRL